MPVAEKVAMRRAIERLADEGEQIDERSTSDVRGVEATLRELRPRVGRSPWRAFYRRIGDLWYVGAFGPEANVSAQGFRRAVRLAVERLAAVESGGER